MIIIGDSRRTIGDALQLLVQGEDELRKRKVLARISVGAHLGYDEGRKEGGASPQADRTGISATRCHADYSSYSHPHMPLSNAHAHDTHSCYTDTTTNQRLPSQRQRPNHLCSPRPLPRFSIFVFFPGFPALRHLVSRKMCSSATVQAG
jgi:hypothetical protein